MLSVRCSSFLTNSSYFLSPHLKPLQPNLPHIFRHCGFSATSHHSIRRCVVAEDAVLGEDDVVTEWVHEQGLLPTGLRRQSLPKHVAVIMDGNRRWARTRGLPIVSGYEAGMRAVRVLVELCCRWGIRVLTIFAFSSDNWLRPKIKVDFLMRFFERVMKDELDDFMREDIQISIIGDSSKLPDSLRKLITNAEERTKHNSRLQLIVAVNYSGKYDMVQACQNIALKVKDGLINPWDINEALIEEELETNCTEFPYPDLLIRSGGELRVSNFFLWQLAYTELFFTQSYWPDFGESEFLEALQSFQQRQRRYGGKDF